MECCNYILSTFRHVPVIKPRLRSALFRLKRKVKVDPLRDNISFYMQFLTIPIISSISFTHNVNEILRRYILWHNYKWNFKIMYSYDCNIWYISMFNSKQHEIRYANWMLKLLPHYCGSSYLGLYIVSLMR